MRDWLIPNRTIQHKKFPALIISCLFSFVVIFLSNLSVELNGQMGLADISAGRISINASIIQDHEGTSDPNLIYYDVQNFDIGISNRSDLCPTGNCNYSFTTENKEGFRLDNSSGWMLHGLLKVTDEGDSKIFQIYGYFSRIIPDEEKNVASQEALDGTIQFYIGDDALGKEYQVNGSLIWKSEKNANLSLTGRL
jgi:hypothetical protein